MLRGLAAQLEEHHGVRSSTRRVRSGAALSIATSPAGSCPTRRSSVLDTAAARVALAQEGTPAAVEELRRRRIRDRRAEARTGAAPRRQAADQTATASWKKRSPRLQRAWPRDADRGARSGRDPQLCGNGRVPTCRRTSAASSMRCRNPTSPWCRSPWTAAPSPRSSRAGPASRSAASSPTRSAASDLRTAWPSASSARTQALDAIARRIQTSAPAWKIPRSHGGFPPPRAHGVGKTETALALSDISTAATRPDLLQQSEYQEAALVATLKGAPPGYVGYGKGECSPRPCAARPWERRALRRDREGPSRCGRSLLPGFRQGDPGGRRGRAGRLHHTVILLTSNAAAKVAAGGGAGADQGISAALAAGASARAAPAKLRSGLPRPPGHRALPAVGRGRARRCGGPRSCARIQQRFEASHRAALSWDQGLVQAVRARAGEAESSARAVDAILTHRAPAGPGGRRPRAHRRRAGLRCRPCRRRRRRRAELRFRP